MHLTIKQKSVLFQKYSEQKIYTDGFKDGQKLFPCQEKMGIFLPLHECELDERFTDFSLDNELEPGKRLYEIHLTKKLCLCKMYKNSLIRIKLKREYQFLVAIRLKIYMYNIKRVKYFYTNILDINCGYKFKWQDVTFYH